MRCFCMQPSKGRRRHRGLSNEASGASYQGLTQRWTYLPWKLWDTRLPTRRSGTFITVSACWEGCLVHCLVGHSRAEKQSGTSCPLWGAICINESTPLQPKKTHGGLSLSLSLGPGERRPTWGSPLGTQGSLPECTRGYLGARKQYWETKSWVKGCPTCLPP